MKYDFRRVRDHIEVFDENGEFVVSADSIQEAHEEVAALDLKGRN